jgi:hypothetical protein
MEWEENIVLWSGLNEDGNMRTISYHRSASEGCRCPIPAIDHLKLLGITIISSTGGKWPFRAKHCYAHQDISRLMDSRVFAFLSNQTNEDFIQLLPRLGEDHIKIGRL